VNERARACNNAGGMYAFFFLCCLLVKPIKVEAWRMSAHEQHGMMALRAERGDGRMHCLDPSLNPFLIFIEKRGAKI